MKKTLIALAVVAVSGAAFAQSSVNLTGKLGVAYQAKKDAAGAKKNGLAVTDGNVTFAAVEDLGGGLKAAASMDVRVRGRGVGVVDGRDASVSLMSGFGTVALGAVESANGIIGLASAGAPTIGQDNGVTLDGGTNIDFVSYTSPALVPGLTARVLIADSIGLPGDGGMEKTAGTQDAGLVGVNYSNGPVAVAADYTKYGLNAVPAATPGAKQRVRVSGAYDLGVVKLGAGFQVKESTAATNNGDKQFMVGVSAPFGPVVVGATYAKRDSDVNTNDATGFELGAQYNLSKRTALQTAYLSQKNTNAKAATHLRVRLMHSF